MAVWHTEANAMTLQDKLRKHGALVLAVLLLALHFSSFDLADRPLVTDVRFFVYFAWQVAEGAVPHLDYFENKTQLASFAGALLHGLGVLTGVDPLMAIRLGYLALAAFGGVLCFFVYRRLGAGSGVAGGLGVLAYCSFGLLGVLPAVGNIPKLLMALAGAGAALLAYRRSWFWAGVVASLAFMDWQVGGLAGIAVLVAAAVHGAPRMRALGRVVAGGVAGLAPFILYYLANGALIATVRQVIGSSLFRGSAAMGQRGLGDRLGKIGEVAELACPSQWWLFYLGLAGMLVTAAWLWVWRRDDRLRLLLPLSIYHFGVVIFSLIDFQYYGDFFLLLHSTVFFLGAVWLALYSAAHRRTVGAQRRVVTVIVLLLVFVVARPGFLRPKIELVTRFGNPAVSLTDQRQVAEAVNERIGDGSVAFLQHSELLYLMHRKNELPLAYWNLPAWSYYRDAPADPFAETGAGMLLSVNADAVVPPRVVGYDALFQAGYVVERFSSDNDRYSVTVAFKPTDIGNR